MQIEEYFGKKAGIVWEVLHEHGPLRIVDLKRKSGLEEAEVYAALGWLGREGKIEIIGEKPLLFKFKLKG